MELDIEEAHERMDKAVGKLTALETNHDLIKRKLVFMASILSGAEHNNIKMWLCLRTLAEM